MALQNAFGHLLPILNDESELDYIPTPIANSTAIAPDDNAFSNILSDASRVLPGADIPPPAPELSDDEQDPSDSGVILSALKFYTGRKRGQQCSYIIRRIKLFI